MKGDGIASDNQPRLAATAMRDESVAGEPDRPESIPKHTLLDRGITVATLPPAALPFLQPQALPRLRTVISAGEACPPDLARAWAAHTQFFNAYGPTETSVCATVGRFGATDGSEECGGLTGLWHRLIAGAGTGYLPVPQESRRA